MSDKRTIDDASHGEWETENKRQAESQSARAAPEQVQTPGVGAVAAGLGGSTPTPRTDCVDRMAQSIVTSHMLRGSTADTINEIVALYSAHARRLEVSLVNAYAHGERMAAGWLALKEAVDTLEEDAIAQRAFWGDDDKHGIAAEAERIYEKAKAALSPNAELTGPKGPV